MRGMTRKNLVFLHQVITRSFKTTFHSRRFIIGAFKRFPIPVDRRFESTEARVGRRTRAEDAAGDNGERGDGLESGAVSESGRSDRGEDSR